MNIEEVSGLKQETLEYSVVEHYHPTLLAEEVNQHIADGWTPLGGVAIGPRSPYDGVGYVYVQAMTRHNP